MIIPLAAGNKNWGVYTYVFIDPRLLQLLDSTTYINDTPTHNIYVCV